MYNQIMIRLLMILLLPQLIWASPAKEKKEDIKTEKDVTTSKEEAKKEEKQDEKQKDIPLLETAQNIFGIRANRLANRIDSFFATDRADDEFGRSVIRVTSNYIIRERDVGQQNNRYRINLRLPHLEEKFKWEYYKKEDKKSEAELSAEEKAEAERKKKRKDDILKSWLFNADAGVVAAIPPRLTLRARLRRNIQTGTLIHRFSEQLTYVTNDEGLREETRLDTDQQISEDILFRFVNGKTWRILSKQFGTSHGPTLFWQYSDDDAFNTNLIMSSTITSGTWYVNNYQYTVGYRRNLYKQWFYLDLIPGIDWPKGYSWRRNPFMIFQVEFIFGG